MHLLIMHAFNRVPSEMKLTMLSDNITENRPTSSLNVNVTIAVGIRLSYLVEFFSIFRCNSSQIGVGTLPASILYSILKDFASS